jgi:ribonuclease BN (tRNA processing enzyme)
VNAHADSPFRAPRSGATLTFLGTGSGSLSTELGRGHAAALLTSHDRAPASFLFDCGEALNARI